jgi:small subunit ribosomal protein S20
MFGALTSAFAYRGLRAHRGQIIRKNASEDKTLANTKSAKKRIRSSLRRRERNRRFRVAARTQVKKARQLLADGNLDEAEVVVRDASSTLDKAARKGIVHPRNAARRKGRLMAALAKARAESAE